MDFQQCHNNECCPLCTNALKKGKETNETIEIPETKSY